MPAVILGLSNKMQSHVTPHNQPSLASGVAAESLSLSRGPCKLPALEGS